MHYSSRASALHRGLALPKPCGGGYVLVLALVFLGIFFTAASAYLSSVTGSVRSERYDIASAQALAIAEAGIDNAVYQLNQNSSYSGETNTALAPGAFTITVSTIDESTKQITATGFVPNSVNPVATKTIKANVIYDTNLPNTEFGSETDGSWVFVPGTYAITR